MGWGGQKGGKGGRRVASMKEGEEEERERIHIIAAYLKILREELIVAYATHQGEENQ